MALGKVYGGQKSSEPVQNWQIMKKRLNIWDGILKTVIDGCIESDSEYTGQEEQTDKKVTIKEIKLHDDLLLYETEFIKQQ